MKYIDSDKLEKLFKQRNKNHNEICLNLYKMVDRICSGARVRPANPDVYDDLKSSITIKAIEAIPKYQTKKNKAFNYFTTVIRNQISHYFLRVRMSDKKWNKYCDTMKPFMADERRETPEF